MLDDNLCVIVPARGGSKGIPGKNIKFLGQEPLVNWAIKIALDIQSVNPSNIYLSTDCSKIMEVGKKCGARVIERPSTLAQDKSTVISMIDHHLDLFKAMGKTYETIIYLEPTSPFRTKKEITECVDVLRSGNFDSVATFAKLGFDVNSLLEQDKDGSIVRYTNLNNTATSPITPYVLSGAVYVFDVNSYMTQKPAGIYFGNRGHVIQTSPHVDIDEPFDLEKARRLLYSLHGTYWDSLDLF